MGWTVTEKCCKSGVLRPHSSNNFASQLFVWRCLPSRQPQTFCSKMTCSCKEKLLTLQMNGEWKWRAWGYGLFFFFLREAFACILNCGGLCWPCLELGGRHGQLVAAPRRSWLLAWWALPRGDLGDRPPLPCSQLKGSTAKGWHKLECLSCFFVPCLCTDGLLNLVCVLFCHG